MCPASPVSWIWGQLALGSPPRTTHHTMLIPLPKDGVEGTGQLCPTQSRLRDPYIDLQWIKKDLRAPR